MQWLTKYILVPKHCYQLAHRLLPWLRACWLITLGYGLIAGLWFAPADYQQGDGFRIIYVHVPSALMAMGIYTVMAMAAIASLVFRIKLAALVMNISAPIGASFTFLALVTGSLWGKPMWGTWWIWDARLTSVLILFFLYIAFIAVRAAITETWARDRIAAWIAIIGFINIPIIHYSVQWWNTLHQGTTLDKLNPSIAPSMLYPLLAMIVSFALFYLIILCKRLSSDILYQERKASWVQEIVHELT